MLGIKPSLNIGWMGQAIRLDEAIHDWSLFSHKKSSRMKKRGGICTFLV
jgi:hypothetical protein